MLLLIRRHLNNETMGLGTKAMDHFDNSALDCGWVQIGTINPSEPQIANKAVVAHYSLTLLNSMSDFLGVEKFTKLHWEMITPTCGFGNNSAEIKRIKSSLFFSFFFFKEQCTSEICRRVSQNFLSCFFFKKKSLKINKCLNNDHQS